MNKRGISHIEIIFAFVMFIAFVSFAVYFFSPIKSNNNGELESQHALDSLMSNVSVTVIKYSVLINNSGLTAVPLDNSLSGLGAYVEDSNGTGLDFNKVLQNIYIKLNVDRDVVSIRLSGVLSSMGNSSLGTVPVDLDRYSIASVSSDDVVSEDRLQELNSSYYSDYENVKSSLGIPENMDFAFYVIIGEENITAVRTKSPSISETFSYEKNAKIIMDNGQIKFGIMRIKIW